jgi:ribonucleotide reductase beta subunit family protein with ferritin-like domain
MSKVPILQKTNSLSVKYPEIVEMTNNQLKIFWLPDEIKVEKDIQDILVNMSETEKHGVITTLKLFSLYELKAGAEYWGSRFTKSFKRPEFLRLGATFAMFELAIHKPFYNKINEALHLDTDEFYTSYVEDETLKARMDFIDSIVSSKDDLISLGGFSMVEGAILYSSFAFLKHFQSQGKNKLLNIVRGINFSVRDENLHSMAGAWVFKKLIEESNYSKEYLDEVRVNLTEMAMKLYDHECRIIDMIFEKGNIDGITPIQMKHFVESRINECMKQLGYGKVFDVKYNPIAEYFYKAINDYTFNDFFTGIGNQYHRNWDSTAFSW